LIKECFTSTIYGTFNGLSVFPLLFKIKSLFNSRFKGVVEIKRLNNEKTFVSRYKLNVLNLFSLSTLVYLIKICLVRSSAIITSHQQNANTKIRNKIENKFINV